MHQNDIHNTFKFPDLCKTHLLECCDFMLQKEVSNVSAWTFMPFYTIRLRFTTFPAPVNQAFAWRPQPDLRTERASPSLKAINSRKRAQIAMAYCMWPTWWANPHPVTGGGTDSVLTTLTTACLHMDGLQGRVTLWVIGCRPRGWRSWKSQVNVYTFNINRGSTSLLCHWKINARVWDTERYQSALFLFWNLNK